MKTKTSIAKSGQIKNLRKKKARDYENLKKMIDINPAIMTLIERFQLKVQS